ncbi:MAG: VaFE repeat-containing surface-anchored protein [Clostridia bacterium]|nr:VaFE repeat-containing surface-anchored protein [Clostridia bacterium]
MKENKNRGVAARPMEMAKSIVSALLVMALAFSAIIGLNTKKADAAGINGWTTNTTLNYSVESGNTGSALTRKIISDNNGNRVTGFCMNPHLVMEAISGYDTRVFHKPSDSDGLITNYLAYACVKNNTGSGINTNTINGTDSNATAKVEKYLKTILYYGWYSQSAEAISFRNQTNSSLSAGDWYTPTQAAVWQITMFANDYISKEGTTITELVNKGSGMYTTGHENEILALLNKALNETSAPSIEIGLGNHSGDGQDVIFGGGTHSIGTVVKVDSVDRGDETKALKLRPDQANSVTKVTDTVSYTDFDEDTYVFYGELHEKNASSSSWRGSGRFNHTVDSSNKSGTVDVTIALENGVSLEAGKEYVVIEYVYTKADVDANNSILGYGNKAYDSHTDRNAPSQTIVVEGGTSTDPSIKTKVSVNGQTGAPATFNINDVQNATITDTITYSNFNDSTKEYDIYAELWKLGNASDTKVGSGSYKGVKPDAGGTGEWNMTIAFDTGFQFEANTDYVVYEYVVNKNQDITADPYETTNVANHKDRADNNQIIRIVDGTTPPPSDPRITTSVSVVASTGPKTPSLSGIKLEDVDVVDPVAVTDTITYSGMTAGETWNISGTLMDITNGPANATAVAWATGSNYSATGETGTWEMDFGNVSLELDHYYVVYEEATRTSDNKYIEHKNPRDKAQTIVVGNPPDPFTESSSQNTNETGNTTTEAPATTLDGSTIKEGTNGKTKGPRTGDGNTLMTLIAAAGISAGALSLTLGARKNADK